MMKRLVMAAALGLSACGSGGGQNGNAAAPVAGNPAGAAGEPVTFRAPDQLTIFARRYRAQNPKALILLFHQAGSSKGEYAEIGPKLAAAGYDAVAVDARSGGDMYGDNETVLLKGKSQPYLDAKQDLQAALDWAGTQKLPVVLWGSSYSSSLVFPIAAENPGKVKAVVAFSPGEYFDDKRLIEKAAAKVTVPVFVAIAPTAEERAKAAPVFGAIAARDKTMFVPADGIHGSSTLIESKNPKGAESIWRAVMSFMKKLSDKA